MTIATEHGSYAYPTVSSAIAASDEATLDAAVQAVKAQKDAWTHVSAADRARLCTRLMRDFHAQAERWVAACLQAKGLSATSPFRGEEWAAGPYTIMRHLRQYVGSLSDVAKSGYPKIPGPVTVRPDGQVVAQIFPVDGYDKALFSGLKGELWMEPGTVTKANFRQSQAALYHQSHEGKVALVLAAGNVSSIGPLDIFYKLFNEDQVVVCKMNPVNEYLGPIMEDAFKALIEPGYLRVVYGGAKEGAYLCSHPDVDEIHVTGSDKTFEAIVFGPGADGRARKAQNEPVLTKRITGELGNVSPVIVVPGTWSASDITYQAEHLVTMLSNNAGFNCNATRVIVTSASWPQRQQLLDAMRDIMRKLPTRQAYYPGAHDRQQAFVAAHPSAETFGTPQEGELPWTLIAGVSPDDDSQMVFTTEAFCSLFAESGLEASSTQDFLTKAVTFVNDHVWGTLSASILIHPSTLREKGMAQALDRAVADLRYGSIGVNYWGGTGFILGTTTWGAFPGHTFSDIQSGMGVVHDTLLFDHVQKVVLRSPFRTIPTPPFFATRGRAS
ncbi:MAG TPA: aldehyde dehydrogenase family protein, partial [Ktedonobacterales bacterium]